MIPCVCVQVCIMIPCVCVFRCLARRTCPTKPSSAGCTPRCGPALWASRTTVATPTPQSGPPREQVSVRGGSSHTRGLQSTWESLCYAQLLLNVSVDSGVCPSGSRYSHAFMLQLRFCEAAFVRPRNLDMIPGVTDNKPGNSPGNTLGNTHGNTVLSLRSIRMNYVLIGK